MRERFATKPRKKVIKRMARSWCAMASSGEGRNYVVLHSDPTAHAELLAVRDATRRLGTRDLSDCDVYSTATPCPMCQGALYSGRIRRVFTESTLENGFAPKLGC